MHLLRNVCSAVLFAINSGQVLALECGGVVFSGAPFTVCEVDPVADDIRLFHSDRSGMPIGTFQRLVDEITPANLLFAMNAGMFHPNRSPVGLYKENGQTLSPIVLSAGPGNFGLLPNGVFCISDRKLLVVESHVYASQPEMCRDASQSGPMLVIDNEIHPRFIPESSSRFIRNGVGVSHNGERAAFVVSDEPVNFYEFARLFRDHLGTPNALYFDGKVSMMYAKELNRSDFGFPVGPMVAVVETGNLD
jgi:uncharacterized protein YigE (DUF2233 family)